MVTQSPVSSANSKSLTGMAIPGGFPRHYRVQRFDVPTRSWQFAAISSSREEAVACYQRLVRGGDAARLVDYTRCVTGV